MKKILFSIYSKQNYSVIMDKYTVNPCLVKVYRGIVVKDNNYKKYQDLSYEDLKRIIQKQPTGENYYKKLNKSY